MDQFYQCRLNPLYVHPLFDLLGLPPAFSSPYIFSLVVRIEVLGQQFQT
jgi:hypothetical protein